MLEVFLGNNLNVVNFLSELKGNKKKQSQNHIRQYQTDNTPQCGGAYIVK